MASKKRPAEAALQFLARKDYSVAGLYRAMKSKGYEDGEIMPVLVRLSQEKYLDDTRFAEERIRHLRENGKGRMYIEEWLKEQGVDEEEIRNVMDRQFTLEDEVRYVTKTLEITGVLTDSIDEGWKERTRRYRRLVSAGFSREALEACGYGDDGT